MLNFNLLPPKEKEGLLRKKTELSLNKILEVFLLFSLILGGFILGIYIYFNVLIINYQDLIKDKKESVAFKEAEKTRQMVIEVNKKIKKISDFQKKDLIFYPIIEEIINSIPSKEVYLNQIKIISKKEEDPFLEVSLSGFAFYRDGVLELEKALKASPRFFDLTSPFTNLIQPQDIDFSFTFKAK